MSVSLFEITMLICFGAAWPLAIVKSIRSRRTGAKSLPFLCVVLIGYISGVLHKLFYHMDVVIWLYALNGTMVAIDIGLYLRNHRFEQESLAEAPCQLP